MFAKAVPKVSCLGMRAVAVIAPILLATTLAAQDNGYWRAVSNTARSITGDIAISGDRMSMNFVPTTIAEIHELTAEQITTVFNFPDGVNPMGHLYRLNIPGDRKLLHKNTLCGAEDTQWMATAVSGKTMQLAFFSGNMMPTMKAEDMNNDTPTLCGTFTYSR